MPKRVHNDDEGSRDPPDVIQGRRRATVNPKFRAKKLLSGAEGTSTPSAFAGITVPPAQSGFVFGTGAAGANASSTPFGGAKINFGKSLTETTAPAPVGACPPFSFGAPSTQTRAAAPVGSTPAFSFGAPSTGTTAAAPVVSTPAFSFGAPSTGTTAAAPVVSTPAFSFGAPSTGNAAAIPTGGYLTAAREGFSFPKVPLGINASSTVPASNSPPAKSPGILPTATVASPQPSKPQSDVVSMSNAVVKAPNGLHMESGETAFAVATKVVTRSVRAPFGEGTTAAKGTRLNKHFATWLSHSVEANSACSLEHGLRDYIAYAAEIRLRVELSTDDTAPQASTAFKHPSMPSAAVASKAAETPLLAVASTASASASPVSATPAPSPPLAAPPALETPAPAPLVPAAAPAPTLPAFSFASPSTLPPVSAPSGKFLFSLPSAPSSTAPVGGIPSGDLLRRFPLNPPASRGVSFKTPAAQTPFRGFQLPSGGAIAPPAPAAEPDEEAMPKEDPSKLQRAQGEELEEILHEVRAKLFRFKKDENTWSDMGIGVLRLMEHKTNNASRLILRNDMGKVLLNVALYAGMNVSATKNTIKFIANVVDVGPSTLMIKVKPDALPPLHKKVLKQLPSQ